MHAIRVDHFGEPDVLKLVETQAPQMTPGEVLVRVDAAGVNPVDWAVRSGAAGERFGSPPYIPGWDISGVIEAAGPGTGSFEPGDRVYGMPRFPAMASAYAEQVTAPAAHLAAAPAHISDADAAGLPLAGLTALQALDLAGVVSGQRVLVHAAAGGVGHLAVQLAKARGAYVLGTARAGKHEFLRDLGVDEPIDYAEVAFEDVAKDVDLVHRLDRRGVRRALAGRDPAGRHAHRDPRRRQRRACRSGGSGRRPGGEPLRAARTGPGWPGWPNSSRPASSPS